MTAKAAGVEPGEYFRDILLGTSGCKDVTHLTPHGWKFTMNPKSTLGEMTSSRN